MLGFKRVLAGAALFTWVFSSCGGSDDTTPSGQKACVPGAQTACSCENGAHGAQTCRADGKSYAPCQCTGNDAGADAAIDQGADTTSDQSAADAPAETSNDAPAETSSGCVYPTDDLSQATWPAPTPGACVGNAAVTCDGASHQMVTAPCATGTTCKTYDIVENPDSSVYTQPGRTYTWAGCVPDNAPPCSYYWSPQPGFYPPGQWLTSYVANCNGNDTFRCMMPSYPMDQAYFDIWAGTTTGFVIDTPCAADETCADDPQYPGNPGCYASPLTPCTTADSSCSGNVLYDCQGYPYQKKVDCGATGAVCREDCAIGLPYQPAECRPPLPSGAVPCDSSSFVPSCVSGDTIQKCDECFQENGQCKCYSMQRSCNELGCGFSTSCQCANVTVQGTTSAQCIDAQKVLCDPATTPDKCNGTQAETCIGYLSDIDCSKYSEVCELSANHAGCVKSPATSCDASLTPSCVGNAIHGCCPASGSFATDAYTLTCVPNEIVEIPCSAFYAPMTCHPAIFGAYCGL